MTGVFASAGRFAGRSTSACSFVPSASAIEAWLQVEPGGGGSALAGADRARAATATAGASRVRMETDNACAARTLRLLVERQRGEDRVDRDQREALERHRLAVARDLPHRERREQQRPDVDGREVERQLVREQ